jgi:hypothetical protein
VPNFCGQTATLMQVQEPPPFTFKHTVFRTSNPNSEAVKLYLTPKPEAIGLLSLYTKGKVEPNREGPLSMKNLSSDLYYRYDVVAVGISGNLYRVEKLHAPIGNGDNDGTAYVGVAVRDQLGRSLPQSEVDKIFADNN